MYQNRSILFSDDHRKGHAHLPDGRSPRAERRYPLRSKPSKLSADTPTEVSIERSPLVENVPRTPLPISVLNNGQQGHVYNPVRPALPFELQSQVLPVLDARTLDRFVHLDLKGAAPKVDYYEKLFPYLKQLGATGVLIEYEDMFPFTGRLSIVPHGLAHTKADIERILQLAKRSNLKVMPLLQVYGHLEYVLKLKEFVHLREDQQYPQVITPCLEESYKLIFGTDIERSIIALSSTNVSVLFRDDRSDALPTSRDSVPAHGLR